MKKESDSQDQTRSAHKLEETNHPLLLATRRGPPRFCTAAAFAAFFAFLSRVLAQRLQLRALRLLRRRLPSNSGYYHKLDQVKAALFFSDGVLQEARHFVQKTARDEHHLVREKNVPENVDHFNHRLLRAVVYLGCITRCEYVL